MLISIADGLVIYGFLGRGKQLLNPKPNPNSIHITYIQSYVPGLESDVLYTS